MKKSLYAIPPLVLQNLVWIPTRIFLKFFVHLKINGRKNLDGLPRGVIFAINHASEMDSIILPASFPFFSRFLPMFYVSREKQFYKGCGWRKIFYGGYFFKIFGAYPAIVGLNNYELSLKNNIDLLCEDRSVCIFPEGRTTRDGNMAKPKGGVTFLSWRSGKPIVPVYIANSWHLSLVNFLLRRRRVSLTFGKPIYPIELFAPYAGKPIVKGIGADNFLDSAEFIMDRIKQLAGAPYTVPVVSPILVSNLTTSGQKPRTKRAVAKS